MKLFVFTDPHGNGPLFEKIAKKVKREKPEVILCAGDISAFGRGIKRWLEKLDSLKIPVLIIPGNHETNEELQIYGKKLRYVHNIHLKTQWIGSVLFIGCGGGGFTQQHAEFERSEKDFARDIKKLKVKDKKHKTVFLVHQPPFDTKLDYLWWLEGHVGSKSIRRFIEKYHPELCITGHLYENFNKEDKIGKTRIINPGPKGKIIRI